MIKRLIILSLLPLQVTAQRLTVDQNTVDVGKTGYQMPVTATFQLHNKGLKHITISTVKADCGCTQADWPKGTIAGGRHFQITLTYDARMLGHFEKQAAVMIHGQKEPLWLTMKGIVDADYRDYSKQYPYNFGGLLTDISDIEFDDVNKGDKPQLELKVLNNTSANVTPNFLHLPSWLTAVAQPEVLAPAQGGSITLTLNSLLLNEYGLTQQSVYLAKTLGEKVSADISMPLSVVLLPDLTAFDGANRQNAPHLQLSADHLNLGQQGSKMRTNGIITLKNTGRSPLVISSLRMFTGGMTVTLGKRELRPGASTKLKVTIDRDQLLSERAKPRVLMITNDPDRPKVSIHINVE